MNLGALYLPPGIEIRYVPDVSNGEKIKEKGPISISGAGWDRMSADQAIDLASRIYEFFDQRIGNDSLNREK